ncbi:MAG: beta-lactamase family protein, partial [Pseudomonadales bacterium]|nr:beta-lactamase family protein [Pseudomonadales bacterium]
MIRITRMLALAGIVAITCACATQRAPDTVADGDRAIVDRLAEQYRQTQRREDVLFWSPEERATGFRHIDHIFPTRTVQAGDQPLALTPASMDLSSVTYNVDGVQYSLADFVAMPANVGLIVVKDGRILYEHYSGGNDENSVWISFSVTKSITSMLIGAAIKDGYIESVDEPVVNYLPRLRGSAYEAATIRNVLQMASGVAWNEDYADRDSDVAKAGGANGIVLLRYLKKLPGDETPGTTFNYNTGETNLVGAILRAAIGNNASSYLEYKIWRPFGMSHDANWITDAPGGAELGG